MLTIASNAPRRLQYLDVLRGVALALVLSYHTIPVTQQVLGYHWWVILQIRRMGWSGVDLFFVLSGFLVTGLLCAEYRNTGRVHPGRFLLRRAFKIYPGFYSLLSLTLLAQAIGLWHSDLRQWLGECFFLQNYLGLVWGHTWSLAVEEHFYLLIAAAFWIASRAGLLDRPSAVFGLGSAVLVGVLSYRFWLSRTAPFDYPSHMFATHVRIDALVFGALLGYGWHFHGDRLKPYLRSERWVLLVLAVGCLAPLTRVGYERTWMHSIGFTCNYLGYGILLMLGIGQAWQIESRIIGLGGQLLALIGRRSYSIYLWHLPIFVIVDRLLPKTMQHDTRFFTHSIVYVSLSILVGSLMERILEAPMLQFRDRIVPADGTSRRRERMEFLPNPSVRSFPAATVEQEYPTYSFKTKHELSGHLRTRNDV